MKNRFVNAVAILLIAAISLGFGYVYTRYSREKELEEYPRKYQAEITPLSYTYSVPVAVIYASVKVRSDFDPALTSDDGKTGLFQLTAEQYAELEALMGNEPTDPGLLYQPSTSLRLGVFWISHLFSKYGDWNTVYAAMYVGEDIADSWVADESVSTDGRLTDIPDKTVSEYVKLMADTVKKYNTLYETADNIAQ